MVWAMSLSSDGLYLTPGYDVPLWVSVSYLSSIHVFLQIILVAADMALVVGSEQLLGVVVGFVLYSFSVQCFSISRKPS